MTTTEIQQVFMLALCVYREASGESKEGKLLVAQVIKNRVLDKRWPDTYTGVITQKLQFSSFNPGDPNSSRWPKEGNDQAWEDSVEVAEKVINSPSPFTTANHYHTLQVSPPWADPTRETTREGNHVFYTL